MPFAYYQNLSARQKRIYRQSDAVTALDLRLPVGLEQRARALEALLANEDRASVELCCQEIADAIVAATRTPPVEVKVLRVRPSNDWGELHGLYEPREDEPPARVSLWMRTAQRKKVVAFKTFLRTLVHELLHHLDYEYLYLAETFHTEGFFKRESALVRQLLGEPPQVDGSGTPSDTAFSR